MLSFSLAFKSSEWLSSAEPPKMAQIFLIRHRSEGEHLVTTEEMSIMPSLFSFHSPFVLHIKRMAAVLKVSRTCPNSLCKGYDSFQPLHRNAVEIKDALWVLYPPLDGGKEQRLLWNQKHYFCLLQCGLFLIPLIVTDLLSNFCLLLCLSRGKTEQMTIWFRCLFEHWLCLSFV